LALAVQARRQVARAQLDKILLLILRVLLHRTVAVEVQVT
jgi:hypothetical protein